MKKVKKILSLILLALLVLCSTACESAAEPEISAAPTETPEPKPEGYELWLDTEERRFSMEYDTLAEYWSLLTDEYYGEDIFTVINILASAENSGLDAESYKAEIASKRAEFAESYGADWHYSISDSSFAELPETVCENFAAELQKLYESARVLTAAAEKWTAAELAEFASSLGCSTENAEKLIAAYAAIGEKCGDAEVQSARDTVLTLEVTGGGLTEPVYRQESVRVYELDGFFVSEALIDASITLLNLVY